MTTALIYVRQSRHKESEKTTSPEVQRHACAELPAVKACDSVEVIEDLDISGGKTKERPGYQRLLERVRSGSVDVVAAYDQSRAFRNTAAALEFYALMEKHSTIEVVFVHGRFDRTAVGGFSYAVLAAAHEMERRMTADKIREAYASQNAKGLKTGPVPLGYKRNGPRSGGEVYIDATTSALVLRIFNDYASGQWSTRELAHRLNAEGAIPAGRKPWAGDTLLDMLVNPTYIAKVYSESRRRKTGHLVDAAWPALISDELWAAVQSVMAKRRRGGRRTGPGRAYVFQRLLVCACGRHMYVRQYHRPNYAYYKCRAADQEGTCGAESVRETDLLPWADEFFERLDALRPADFAARLASGRAGRRVSVDAIERLDRTMERLKDLYTLGDLEREDYIRRRDTFLDQRTQLMAARPSPAGRKLEGLLDAWRTGDPVIQRRLLASLFDAIYVQDGKIVEVKPRADRAQEVTDLLDELDSVPAGICSKGGEGGI